MTRYIVVFVWKFLMLPIVSVFTVSFVALSPLFVFGVIVYVVPGVFLKGVWPPVTLKIFFFHGV